MSVERAFADTNIFVYATDEADPIKRARAREVLAGFAPGELVVSAQVLSEYYTAVTRKIARPLAPADGAEAVRRLAAYPVVPIDADLVRTGIELSATVQLSYWDALILAAARASGCTRLLTEDLNTGAVLAGVRVVNPLVAADDDGR